MSSLPLQVLRSSAGFSRDPRFARPLPLEDQPADPLSSAWAAGHAAGMAEARAEAEALHACEAEARHKIELALARLDGEQQEVLRRRLVETVAALCDAALAPLAIDPDLLAERAGRAAAMLARADDAAVLRLHPEDLALVAGRLPGDLPVDPDPALERGNIRIDGLAGGVEDGPGQWRRAIAEALDQC